LDEREAVIRFDLLLEKMMKLNSAFSDDEVAADLEFVENNTDSNRAYDEHLP
jgi:hypothetical protein